MPYYPSEKCYDKALDGILRAIITSDVIASPRGKVTRERFIQTLTLSDPSYRLLGNPARKFNIFKAVGTFLWMMRGGYLVEDIGYYDVRAKAFGNSKGEITAPYGRRIRNYAPTRKNPKGLDQLQKVLDILNVDTDSRRAFISIYDPRKDGNADQEVACASSLQFFIRGERLHCITTMRSADVLKVTPYDVFIFGSIQEWVASELGIDCGMYIHSMVNAHVYEDDMERALDVIKNQIKYPPLQFPSLKGIHEVPIFEFEEAIRKEESIKTDLSHIDRTSGWYQICMLLGIYRNIKSGHWDYETTFLYHSLTPALAYMVDLYKVQNEPKDIEARIVRRKKKPGKKKIRPRD